MTKKIIFTADGSHTLVFDDSEETYHSKFGAINESIHIFIEAGFGFAAEKKQAINILEVGFGTGLNALLTLSECQKKQVLVQYTAYEPSPIDVQVVKKLNYSEYIHMKNARKLLLRMHQYPNTIINITKQFKFLLCVLKIQHAILTPNTYELVYFDAFAPQFQPELWTFEVFSKISQSMQQGGVLVTYSSKGEVRRILKSLNFHIEKIPGPVGKREFIRAIKI